MPKAKEAPKWNCGSIREPKEKIGFGGTVKKTEVQCGFRECKARIAECKIGCRRVRSSGLGKVDWPLSPLVREVDSQVGKPALHGRRSDSFLTVGVFIVHGAGGSLDAPRVWWSFGGEWNSATPRN